MVHMPFWSTAITILLVSHLSSSLLLSQMLVTIFNGMYLFIVYDVVRNPYYYMFTDVSDTFMCK
jgi:hypothetical protein